MKRFIIYGNHLITESVKKSQRSCTEINRSRINATTLFLIRKENHNSVVNADFYYSTKEADGQ